MMPDEPNQEERLEELNQDYETPFRPAKNDFDTTHPVTDSGSNIQPEELYEEGVAGAVEASEPNAGSAVMGYDPESDQRRKNDYENI